ncbi:MAG: hypothetical protein AB8C84_03445 [Oligoflexales bacterium]
MLYDLEIDYKNRFLCSSYSFLYEQLQEIDFLFEVLADHPSDLKATLAAWLFYRTQQKFSFQANDGIFVEQSFCHFFRQESQDFGLVDVLYEKEHLGVYCLRIFPGREIPEHFHQIMSEDELVLSTDLIQMGQKVPQYSRWKWHKGQVHSYKNMSSQEQSLLCVDRPCFQPGDEILV